MRILNFIFRKKPKKEGLEKAQEMNLITREEFLELKISRVERELKEYLGKGKKRKKD